MSKRYRKKPVEIEAMQLTATNRNDVVAWIDERSNGEQWLKWTHPGTSLEIRTPEGDMTARPGDYVIRGISGEFYPCKPDIFDATYEPLSEVWSCPHCGSTRWIPLDRVRGETPVKQCVPCGYPLDDAEPEGGER